MPWVYTYYTVPTGSTAFDTDDMLNAIQQSINNGLSSGSVPTDFAGMGSFFGVNTSGAYSSEDFRGKQIPISRYWENDGQIQ